MKYNKIFAKLLPMMLSVIFLIGCNNNTVMKKYDSEAAAKTIASGVVASNDNFELQWDDEAKCVLLISKKTGKIWSDILYDAYLNGTSSANAKSAINITVAHETNLTWETYSSAAEMGVNGKMICEQIEDGVCVTYYFENFQIAVPVTYKLRDDSLAISIDGSEIQEGDSVYKLVSVSIAPYFCSAANSKDNYLFVPSGSGALMYTEDDADGTRRYSGEVYGLDAARRILNSRTNEEAVRLPVFGAKNNNSAVLGIIENGAGAAFIEAQAGYARLEHSQVGATFYFRGYDTFRYGTYATGNTVITRISKENLKNTVTVAYYPLEGEEADYNGMAKRYRKYLLDSGALKGSDTQNSPYSITLLGGTTVTKSFFGIPYDTVVPLTKFSDAENILKELTETNGSSVVRLMNYGDNGLKPGIIGGGSNYDSVFGSQKELEDLQSYCEEMGLTLFWDSDIVRYSKSGNGFSYNADCALTAIHYRATQYPVTPIRQFDEDNPYHIISRTNLAEAMQKAIMKADKYNHSALSFSTFGELAFSDYTSDSYVMKAGIEKDIIDLLSKAGEKREVAVAGANSYAACAADVIFDVPFGYGEYDALDEQIPFYQMVFHSYKPMYSVAVNTAENAKKQVMLAAAGGTGIGFTVISEYVKESNDLEFNKLYGTLYKDQKENVAEALNNYQFAEFYNKTADSVITRYELFDNGVSATYFENGVVLYANHTNDSVYSPVGTLEAYMFKAH